jgi:imidazolonepropionase-like amidohydrolase
MTSSFFGISGGTIAGSTGVLSTTAISATPAGTATISAIIGGSTAITLNGAYTYFEEASKGSLEVGKTADLVILDRNPLKVDPNTIRDIDVVETVKSGKSVYRAPKS